jgi:hypothetical protein
MKLERSVPTRVGRPATPTHSIHRGTIALVGISLATLSAVTWLSALYLANNDPCALPKGAGTLNAEAQAILARHAVACRDVENGRMTLEEYRALDAPPPAVEPVPQVEWASSVRAVSSEYAQDRWSAREALGPPDVYPRSGDEPHAWASRDPDAPFEFIEVGFATPRRVHGIQVVETYSPGAITEVEILTASGARKIVYQQPRVDAAPNAAQISTFEFACSEEPIIGARVTLASGQVPGWNEIDAIGALPCR